MNTENNTLIAEFMGGIVVNESEIYFDVALFRYTLYTKNIPFDELLYDTDWNWLMEVVEKIENISFNKSDIFFNVTIGSGLYCTIQDSNFDGLLEINTSEETRIKTVYKAVVEFIKWHNENK
jgi:hypothetical protein